MAHLTELFLYVQNAVTIMKSKMFDVKKKVKVYVASPYTKGSQSYNVRRSIQCGDELRDLGCLPYLPLLSHFWDFLIPHTYEYWMRMCIDWLLECDFVLRLEGESSGADYEESVARQYGIPVVYSITELKNIIDGGK